MSDVYISGSLTHTPQDKWDIYEKIGKLVEEFGLKPYIPHIHTPQNINRSVEQITNSHTDFDDSDTIHKDIFHNDILFVEKSKLVVAEVSNPSIGTGVELGIAFKIGKPVIFLAKKDAVVSSFVRGPVQSGLAHLIRYESEEDAMQQLKAMLESKFGNLK